MKVAAKARISRTEVSASEGQWFGWPKCLLRRGHVVGFDEAPSSH